LGGLPRALLPGGVCDFSVHLGRGRSCGDEASIAEEPIDLEVDIVLWVWVAPPEDDVYYAPLTSEVYDHLPEESDPDDDDDDDSTEGSEDNVGAVQVSAKCTDVPENALPWVGVLTCPGMEQVHLDGTQLGPFRLRRSHSIDEASEIPDACPLAGLALEPKLPRGLDFKLKDLGDRQAELQGGCELFRLAKGIPVTLGFLQPLRRRE
jgi:hypothetical protein